MESQTQNSLKWVRALQCVLSVCLSLSLAERLREWEESTATTSATTAAAAGTKKHDKGEQKASERQIINKDYDNSGAGIIFQSVEVSRVCTARQASIGCLLACPLAWLPGCCELAARPRIGADVPSKPYSIALEANQFDCFNSSMIYLGGSWWFNESTERWRHSSKSIICIVGYKNSADFCLLA